MSEINRRRFLAATGMAAATVVADPGRAASADSLSLKGKSFLITGTSSGFGRLGALHYARLGARVFATMRNLPRAEADELREAAKQEDLDLHVLQLDVLSDDQVNKAVAEAERLNGGALDVLVNNAGLTIMGPVEIQDLEAAQLLFGTNVFGYQRTVRAVLPAMRQRRSGLIVNVSSQAGRLVWPGLGLYSATKFAVEAMSENLAYELVQHGIDVTIIEPTGYPTRAGATAAPHLRALLERADDRHTSGYPDVVAGLRAPSRSGAVFTSDPMDVPRAIAELAALPAGRRPLRRPVNPLSEGTPPQEEINRVSMNTQLAKFGNIPHGPAIRAVYD